MNASRCSRSSIAFPASALPRNARVDRAALPRGTPDLAADGHAPLRPAREADLAQRDQVPRCEREGLCAPGTRTGRTASPASVHFLRGFTCAGRRDRPTRPRPGVWTFGLPVPAPSVNDAFGADGPTKAEDCSLDLVPRACPCDRRAGDPVIVLRRLAVPLALDRRIAVAAGQRVRGRAPGRDRRLLPSPRMHFSFRSAGSSTATSRRWRPRGSARRS